MGQGEPPLVMIPGGLTGWVSFLPLVPALSEDRRVVRVQPILNAEGIAGCVGDPSYDTDVERESLRLTLAEAGVSGMHLLGWSNGGRAALDFALAHPEGIRSVTAIEPAAWWLVVDEAEDARRFDESIARLSGCDVSEDDLIEFLRGAGLGGPDVDFRALPQWELWSSCRNTLSWYGERARESARVGIEGIERLESPVLLLRGTRTSQWLRRVVDVLADRLPNATVVDLEGGHACILESPEAFTAALERHVGDGSSARATP
jgi:pimeloyl-ACP methyl ester carboxylesterase